MNDLSFKSFLRYKKKMQNYYIDICHGNVEISLIKVQNLTYFPYFLNKRKPPNLIIVVRISYYIPKFVEFV